MYGGMSAFCICFENSDYPLFRPFTPIWSVVTLQRYSKPSSKQNAPTVNPHWMFKPSMIWYDMQCQLVNNSMLGEPATSLFRSEQSKKKWKWRQHVPLNGNCVPTHTASYPRRLASSTPLWEPQNFALLHTSFHSFQLRIKGFAHTKFSNVEAQFSLIIHTLHVDSHCLNSGVSVVIFTLAA
jgi:hypothetical protein